MVAFEGGRRYSSYSFLTLALDGEVRLIFRMFNYMWFMSVLHVSCRVELLTLFMFKYGYNEPVNDFVDKSKHVAVAKNIIQVIFLFLTVASMEMAVFCLISAVLKVTTHSHWALGSAVRLASHLRG
jgi:hypothetical protein